MIKKVVITMSDGRMAMIAPGRVTLYDADNLGQPGPQVGLSSDELSFVTAVSRQADSLAYLFSNQEPEDQEFPHAAWRQDVAQELTTLGYWEWVNESRLQNQVEDPDENEGEDDGV